jgi:hypothetical protein
MLILSSKKEFSSKTTKDRRNPYLILKSGYQSIFFKYIK